MIGGTVFALFVDRLGVPIKWLLVFLYLLQALSVVFFVVAVYLPHIFGGNKLHVPYWPVFAACIAQGVTGAGIGPLAYELGAELAYPVGEETSATFLAVLGNFCYILAMQLIGDRVTAKVFNIVTIAVFAGCALLLMPMRGTGGRSAVDAGAAPLL
eukprot:SAG22_NODE_2322_length_2717_cov_5.829641_2_plen_156_part_00